jgi:hypothetical protein
MDLQHVSFLSAPDVLTASFTWVGHVPDSGPVLWQVNVTSSDKETIRFLGYKIVDGQHSAHFVHEFGGGWQANLEPDVDLEPGVLTVRFPPLALAGMGNAWTWDAVLSVNGYDVGTFNP